VRGGDQKIWSAGFNFYPNYNLKFMLDWQNIDISRPWTGLSAPGTTHSPADPGFAVRAIAAA